MGQEIRKSSTGWFCLRISQSVAVVVCGRSWKSGHWDSLGWLDISLSPYRGPLHVVCFHGLACASLQHDGLRVPFTQWLMALTQDPANQVECDHLL